MVKCHHKLEIYADNHEYRVENHKFVCIRHKYSLIKASYMHINHQIATQKAASHAKLCKNDGMLS
jgi:hypothetical protein